MDNLKTSSDTLFILLGAIMVLAMHAGFAFLELGTVRQKNQVNALGEDPRRLQRVDDRLFLHRFLDRLRRRLLLGRRHAGAEERLRARAHSSSCSRSPRRSRRSSPAASPSGHGSIRSSPRPSRSWGFVYPFFEGIAWNGRFGFQTWLKGAFGEEFHDFAGSVVVHAMGGWIGLVAVFLLGARRGRYTSEGGIAAHPPSSIPFLALGAWMLSVGWFGFNVMSAQTIDKISGLVAANSLLAMAGARLPRSSPAATIRASSTTVLSPGSWRSARART